MATDPTHPDLCQARKQERANTHACYRNPGHDGPHICVCWHRWTS